MPGRTGPVFGPSKLLLDGGSLKKFSVLTFLRWRGLTKILVLTFITLIQSNTRLVLFKEKAYKSIVKNFKSNNPNASLLNIATDGDPYRSKILNQLKRKNYSIDEIQDLKHFDLNLVFDEFSVNKDPKHVCKRLRCFIISVNSKKDMKLIKTPISRKYDCN